jgi:hypothetical protein
MSPAADHAPNLLLRTAKKNAVDSPHIKIPVKPSTASKLPFKKSSGL